jgi:hypothetical protein
MSFITISTFKAKLTSKLHGASLAKIGNSALYEKMREAAVNMLARIDPPDTIELYRIQNAIYDRIYNYTCPTDIKSFHHIADLRPISPRSQNDEISDTSTRSFDIRKEKNTMAIEDINGVKTLKISKKINSSPILLTEMDSFSTIPSVAQPTFTFSGDITSPVIDTLDYVSGFGALSFGLSGATGQGVITIALPYGIDLSKLLNIGQLFAWLEFPNATRFTNVNLKWGTDLSNYYNNTATVPQGRAGVDTNAWDLMPFPWVTATPVGAPDPANIKYLVITLNYVSGAALAFCKLDSIVAQLGQAYEMKYYSQNLYADAITGVLKEAPSADGDTIQIDPMGINILLYETLRLISQELKGINAASDLAWANYMLEGDGRVMRGILVMNRQGLYRDYIQQTPSGALPLQETYHEFDEIGGGDSDN